MLRPRPRRAAARTPGPERAPGTQAPLRFERSDLGRRWQRRPTPARPPACASASCSRFPRPPRVLLPIIPVSLSVSLLALSHSLALSLSRSFRHTHTRIHIQSHANLYTGGKNISFAPPPSPAPEAEQPRGGGPRTVWKC